MPGAIFDANFLLIAMDDRGRDVVPNDPQTGRPYKRAQNRVRFLLETFSSSKNMRIVIPTPALAEFLILAYPLGGDYLGSLKSLYRVELADFDEMAAIEMSEISIRLGRPTKRESKEAIWARLKFDRQIVAIAAAKAAVIDSTDQRLRATARRIEVQALGIEDIPDAPPKQESLLEGADVP